MPFSCDFSVPIQRLHQLSGKQNGGKYIEKFYRTPIFHFMVLRALFLSVLSIVMRWRYRLYAVSSVLLYR